MTRFAHRLVHAVAHLFASFYETQRRAVGTILRYHYRPRFKQCGSNVSFDPATSQIDYEHVSLGSNVSLGSGAVIGRARIGDDVMFAPNVHLRDGNHRYDLVGRAIRESGDADPGLVEIGSDVWIGDGTTVLRGGRVGEGAVIGTRSVVTRPVPPYVVAAGSPCRVLRLRFTDDDLRGHLLLRGRSPAETEALIADRARALAEDRVGDQSLS